MKFTQSVREFVLAKTDRAVSPVIGVILMVAITVILAAVLLTFVLDLSSSIQQNPQAGVSFDQNGAAGTAGATLEVQIISMENADDLTITGAGTVSTDFSDPAATGETAVVDISGAAAGDRVTVTATLGDKTSVIQTYTVS
jgi:flagellin-like protein